MDAIWFLVSLLLISIVTGISFLMALILGLLKAGRRADEAEEEISAIISPAAGNNPDGNS